MDERIKVLPPKVTVDVQPGGVTMTTVEQTERTEIARDVTDLEIEIHNRRDNRRSRRSVTNALAKISLLTVAVGGALAGIEGLTNDHVKNVPIVEAASGVVFVAGLAGGYAGFRRARGYTIEIDRLTLQDDAILEQRRIERKKETELAKATTASASK